MKVESEEDVDATEMGYQSQEEIAPGSVDLVPTGVGASAGPNYGRTALPTILMESVGELMRGQL